MKKSLKPKILYTLSLIFFFTTISAKISNMYRAKKAYKNNQVIIRSINTISKEEQERIIDLIKTMNNAIKYINDENISYEVKKQLIKDMIDGISVINNKLNIKDYSLIGELNNQYNNLNENKNIICSRLNKLYNEWKLNINQL